MMTDDERMLAKVVRALIGYYGPITLIRATLIEVDNVIEDMAVSGYMKEAKKFAKILEAVKPHLDLQ